MDGRSGSSSMRLNFAGVPDQDIREGIRRIGKVVREQVGLFGTLAGSAARGAPEPKVARAAATGGGAPRTGARGPASPADGSTGGGSSSEADGGEGLADVVALPRRERGGKARRRQDL
jgi:hypothetical protein